MIAPIRHHRLVASAVLLALFFASLPAAASAATAKPRKYDVLVVAKFQKTYVLTRANPTLCDGVPTGATTVNEREELTLTARGKTKVTLTGKAKPTWLRAQIGAANLKGSIDKYTNTRSQKNSICEVPRPSPDGKPKWRSCGSTRNQTLRQGMPVKGSLVSRRLDDIYATTQSLSAYLDLAMSTDCDGPPAKRPDNTIYGLGRLEPQRLDDPGEVSIVRVKGGGWSNQHTWNHTNGGADWLLDQEWTVEISITPAS